MGFSLGDIAAKLYVGAANVVGEAFQLGKVGDSVDNNLFKQFGVHDWVSVGKSSPSGSSSKTTLTDAQMAAQKQDIIDSLNKDFLTDQAKYAARAAAAGVTPTTGLQAHSDTNVAKIAAYELSLTTGNKSLFSVSPLTTAGAAGEHPIIAMFANFLPDPLGAIILQYPIAFDLVMWSFSGFAVWKLRKKYKGK